MNASPNPHEEQASPRRKALYRLIFLAFSLCSLSSRAQNQSYQTWPEIDTYLRVNSSVRLSFFASTTKENRQGTDAEVGPNIDFFLKPLVKLKRITIFDLDQSKDRPLMLRVGYRYMPTTDGPTENRGVLEATGRYPLLRGVLLSDRNRADLRFIAGEFSWRYRNRITAERTFAIRSYHFSPYIRAEVYYDGNLHKWSRTTETVWSYLSHSQARRDRTVLRTSERYGQCSEPAGQCIGPGAQLVFLTSGSRFLSAPKVGRRGGSLRHAIPMGSTLRRGFSEHSEEAQPFVPGWKGRAPTTSSLHTSAYRNSFFSRLRRHGTCNSVKAIACVEASENQKETSPVAVSRGHTDIASRLRWWCRSTSSAI